MGGLREGRGDDWMNRDDCVCVCRDDVASLAEASASLPPSQSAGIVTQEGRGTLLAEEGDQEKTWCHYHRYLAGWNT